MTRDDLRAIAQELGMPAPNNITPDTFRRVGAEFARQKARLAAATAELADLRKRVAGLVEPVQG